MGSLHVEVREGVAVVSLRRPPVNALTVEVLDEAVARLAEVEADPAVRALVLTGSGSSFSAGLDLKEVPLYGPDKQRRMIEQLGRLLLGLYGLGMPTVAAVNGHAHAGGLVLVLTCDYRIGPARPQGTAPQGAATFALSEVRVGVPFPVGPLEVVRGELAPAAARALALDGRPVGAEQALHHGALDELVPAEQVLPRALAVAMDRAGCPRATYAHTKRALRAAALARMQAAVESGRDDLLEQWLTPETAAASAQLLAARAAAKR